MLYLRLCENVLAITSLRLPDFSTDASPLMLPGAAGRRSGRMGGLPQVKLPGKAVQAHTTLLALLAVLLCMLPGALGAPSAHYALQTGAVDAPVIPASDVLDVYWRGFQSNGPYAVMPHFLVSFPPLEPPCCGIVK